MCERGSQILRKSLLAICLFAAVSSLHAACNIVGGKAYGECDGVRVTDGGKGHLTVRGHMVETGIIEGATVLRGGSLDLKGISNGDITVSRGGRLRLTGVVSGTVRNTGGRVEIEGIVDHLYTTGGTTVVGGSVVHLSGNGAVQFKKGAVLGGVPFAKAVSKAEQGL